MTVINHDISVLHHVFDQTLCSVGESDPLLYSYPMCDVSVGEDAIVRCLRPFAASEGSIRGYERGGYGVCIEVRSHRARLGDGAVLWIREFERDGDPLFSHPLWEGAGVCVLGLEEYRREFGGGVPPAACSDDVHVALPQIRVPDAHLALYSDPGDRRQAFLFLRALRALVDSQEVALATTQVDGVRDYAVGLDLDGVPECRVEVGKVVASDEYALKMVANPSFPVWLTTSIARSLYFELNECRE